MNGPRKTKQQNNKMKPNIREEKNTERETDKETGKNVAGKITKLH